MNDQIETDDVSGGGQHCGFVAIIGRPNVGKSTLLNHILGMKLSITSRKPQTTRHQILGVKTSGSIQTIYVDTPGIHQRRGTAINKYMNRAATSIINDVDIILFVVQAKQWTEEDDAIVEKIKHVDCPVVLVVNKMDKLENKKELLPMIESLSSKFNFTEIIPASALSGINVNLLEQKLALLLPENTHFYQSRGRLYLNFRKYKEALHDFEQQLEFVDYIDQKISAMGGKASTVVIGNKP